MPAEHAAKKPFDPHLLLQVAKRGEWRAWLRKNYKREKVIWLVRFKKHTGKPTVSYNDSVEEALSFGWIDSTVRTVDADRYAQRFTPRKPGSAYSQANLERLRAMARRGKVAKDVLAKTADLIGAVKLRAPADILEALRADPEVWKNFQSFSEPYKRIRIGYIEGARDRPAEFAKRLHHFIARTKQNRFFGYGGIEKLY
ncbi:MAG: YdeI/OmpD-associated family protein [Candidatus Aminicenantales bacterium]